MKMRNKSSRQENSMFEILGWEEVWYLKCTKIKGNEAGVQRVKDDMN